MQNQEKCEIEEQRKSIEPITPPSEPVMPPSEPVTPPTEPITQPTEPVSPSDSSVEKELVSGLEEKFANAEAKISELQDALLRANAEMENVRRRMQEDLMRARKFAIEGFAEALLPVKDSLEIALKIETPSIESLKEGVGMTLKQLNSAFEKNRVTEANPMPGEKFDPEKHQAISVVSVEQDTNTIINVLQKGYLIADRLLRPALVTVSQGKSDSNGA